MRNVLRKRTDDDAKVSTAELFFDLVFVFAVTQLSHTLLTHVTPLGVLQATMLFLGVWWTWIFTAWVTNWVDPDTTPVRLLLFALMAAGLFVSMSIPEAFGARGLAFAVAFTSIQVGRSLFMLAALRGHDRDNFRNFLRITIWLVCSGTFWISGGLAEGSARLLLWGIALAIEYTSPMVGFFVPGLGRSSTRDWDVEGHHMAERCGLFIIIALGESIVITGGSFAEVRWDLATMGAFAATFTASIAIWWLYFNVTAERAAQKTKQSDDPGRVARLVYTYIHLAIVGGIIVSAASDEIVLDHPLEPATWSTAALIVGGAALFLVGNLLFKHAIWRVWPLPYLVALPIMGALAVAAPHFTMLTLALLTSAILVITAAWTARHLNYVDEKDTRHERCH